MSTMSPQDVRAGLPRRFTTNALPTLSPIGQQRKQAAGDYTVSPFVNPRDVIVAAANGNGSDDGVGEDLVAEGMGCRDGLTGLDLGYGLGVAPSAMCQTGVHRIGHRKTQ